ncbi:MAG TPA: ABC transporter permease [Anaerolineae bacterium]|nr:ABC transporter permease [Anaerolineae bacterium]
MKVIYLAVKDIMQTMRSPLAVLFLIIMPLLFTAFFGTVFGGMDDANGQLIPVGWLDKGGAPDLTYKFKSLVLASEALNIRIFEKGQEQELVKKVSDKELAAAVIIPADFSEDNLVSGETKLTLVADESTIAGQAAGYPIKTAMSRLMSALKIGEIVVKAVEQVNPSPAMDAAQSAQDRAVASANEIWQTPSISVSLEKADMGVASTDLSELNSAYDQASPGMLVQFAINGVIGTAIVLVLERRSRCLHRLLTTSISRHEIILGHALYMFVIVFVQQILLILAGQFLFGVNYLREPMAIFLIMLSFSLWITGLGMLISVLAKTEDHVVLYSLIAMFLFTALAGAWFPLEGTSNIFSKIGHLTPGAWAMDGFQNIIVRGLGFKSALIPAAVLTLFAAVFLGLSVFLFKFE